jgi:hypothetical protein
MPLQATPLQAMYKKRHQPITITPTHPTHRALSQTPTYTTSPTHPEPTLSTHQPFQAMPEIGTPFDVPPIYFSSRSTCVWFLLGLQVGVVLLWSLLSAVERKLMWSLCWTFLVRPGVEWSRQWAGGDDSAEAVGICLAFTGFTRIVLGWRRGRHRLHLHGIGGGGCRTWRI